MSVSRAKPNRRVLLTFLTFLHASHLHSTLAEPALRPVRSRSCDNTPKYILSHCEDTNFRPTTDFDLSTQCPCTKKNAFTSFDEIRIDCTNSWDLPLFRLARQNDVGNSTSLVYDTEHITDICRGSFQGLSLERVEIPRAVHLLKIHHGAFQDARINEVVIRMAKKWVKDETLLDPGAFTGLRPLGTLEPTSCNTDEFAEAEMERTTGDNGSEWGYNSTGACFSLELNARIEDHSYRNVAALRLAHDHFQGLVMLQRLRLIGHIGLKQPTKAFSHLYALHHLELSGMPVGGLAAAPHALDMLTRLDTLILKKGQEALVDNDEKMSADYRWLQRKPLLRDLRLQGLKVEKDSLYNIDNLWRLEHLSLKDCQLPDEAQLPQAVYQMVNLKTLNLDGTSMREPLSKLSPLTNLTLVVLGSSEGEADYCDCDKHGWLRDWPPYLEHGAGVFQQRVGDQKYSELELKIPTGKVPLSECMGWCNGGHSPVLQTVNTAWIALLIVHLFCRV